MKKIFMQIFYIVLLGLLWSEQGQAYPEFAGDGYFSCTSCHVSTSGGDVITAYGRSFAEEKLVWDAYAGEAMPLHSEKATPEWMLLAGHVRWIQTHYEDAKIKEGRLFNMQRTLDFGFQHSGLFSYVTVTQERVRTYDYDKETLLLDRFLLRYDMTESVSGRYGILAPKFGLNVHDHNAFVRLKPGFGVGTEEGLAEVSWTSEVLEVNASHSAPVPKHRTFIPVEKSEAKRNAYLNVSAFLAEKHRVSFSGLLRSNDGTDQTGGSLSTVLTLSPAFRYALEGNSITTKSSGAKSTANSLYSQLTFWMIKGLYPGLRYEQLTETGGAATARADKVALNLSFHPRPHFELSGSLGLRRDLAAHIFGHTGYLMFHYWL